MMSAYWRRNACQRDSVSCSVNLFGPTFARRAVTSEALRPDSAVTPWAASASAAERVCQAWAEPEVGAGSDNRGLLGDGAIGLRSIGFLPGGSNNDPPAGASRIRPGGEPVATIIPRWEWRTFGTRFGAADVVFRALTPTGIQESDELYLLSGVGDNVKVRDDLMDIKVLKEVNADGLEQWTPVMKAGFPLPAAEVTKVFEALRREVPHLAREAYTLDQFVDELVPTADGLRTVTVHKRRVRYMIGGCISELSDVSAAGKETATVAIESEDAAAVIAAVRSIGLGDYVNTSYPRGLADLIDGTPQRFAVIDVGTNSIKFHLAERHADGTWKTLADRSEVTRIGEGLEDTGRDRSGTARAGCDGDRGDGGRGAVARRAGDRRGGDRRPAHGGQPTGGGRRHPGSGGGHGRGHPRRRGEPAGLPRRQERDRACCRLTGRVRHGRRQLPVHLRPGRPGGRAVQRRRRSRPVHGAVRARRRRLRTRCCGRRSMP